MFRILVGNTTFQKHRSCDGISDTTGQENRWQKEVTVRRRRIQRSKIVAVGFFAVYYRLILWLIKPNEQSVACKRCMWTGSYCAMLCSGIRPLIPTLRSSVSTHTYLVYFLNTLHFDLNHKTNRIRHSFAVEVIKLKWKMFDDIFDDIILRFLHLFS